jgi:hypothetical protein
MDAVSGTRDVIHLYLSLLCLRVCPIKSAGRQDVVKSRNHKTCATPRPARSLPDSQPATKDMQAPLLPLSMDDDLNDLLQSPERLSMFDDDLNHLLPEDEDGTRSQPDLTTSGSSESVDHPTFEPSINTLGCTPCDKQLAVTDNQPTLDGCPARPGSSSMDDAGLESFNEASKYIMAVAELDGCPVRPGSSSMDDASTSCDKQLAELPDNSMEDAGLEGPARPGSSSMDDASLGNYDEAPNSIMAVPEQVPVHQCLNLLRDSEQRFRNIARLLYAAKLLEDGLKIDKEGGSWKVCLKKKQATSNKSGNSVLFPKGECVEHEFDTPFVY